MDKWTQIRVECATGDLDTVVSVMSMVDTSLMIEDANEIDRIDTCYGELIDESLKNADRSVGAVSLYVPEDEDISVKLSFIKERLSELSIKYSLTLSGMKEEDWANSWKQYYKPVRIGKRLIVVPSWEEYSPEREDIVLTMDPGMAFGSGTHETTRLCSTLLEQEMPKGARVLDIGTGSGILAIAASKLGAKEVFAYDIDPVAVRVAQENCESNGCANITCGVSDLLYGVDASRGYDFVCANIVADIIVRMAPDIKRYITKGGLLACSGIIDTQRDRVLAALTDGGMTLVRELKENDWCALLLKN